MPPEAVPFVAAVVAFFGFFIAVVGGTSVWAALPRVESRRDESRSTL